MQFKIVPNHLKSERESYAYDVINEKHKEAKQKYLGNNTQVNFL